MGAAGRDELVLFGGCQVLYGNGENCAEVTWTWNGGSWGEVDAAAPDFGISFSAMAPRGSDLLMFDGKLAGLAAPVDQSLIWAGQWITETNPAVRPSNRYGAVMATLRPGESPVLFGGYGEQRGYIGDLSDTWTFDGSSWTKLDVAGPPARSFATMAQVNGTLVLFGGKRGSEPSQMTALADTWTWDGTAWTEQHVAGPPARYMASMASP
jgi:hypothetical protein